MMRADRRGFGIVIATVFLLLAVMGTVVATSGRRGGLVAHTQSIAEGRRALQIGRSCMDEALADFREQANRPGTPWFTALRGARTSPGGMNHWLVGEFVPKTTPTALGGETVAIEPVRVSVWRDAAVDSAAGPYDEKFALVTLTADVSVTPGGFNPFRGTVRRQVQRSYHVKQVRVTTPQPFGRWSLYVHQVPLLTRQKDDYDRVIRAVGTRRGAIERAYDGEIDEIIAAIERYLAWMQKKVVEWDEIRADLAKLRREREKMKLEDLFAKVLEKIHLPSLLRKKLERAIREVIDATIKPAVEPIAKQLERAIDAIEHELDEDIRRALAAYNLPDEATFRRVAANPYPPANLRTDIAFRLEPGSWPTYRGWTATPEGLGTGGDNLDNPVVVERARVASRELDYHVPAVPDLPARPHYSLASRDIAWTEKYAPITAEFVRYREDYRTSLATWLTAVGAEFTRHEELFHLLPAVPDEYARQLTDAGYQARRARFVFADQERFLAHVTGPDGVARLSGVYAVKGDLTRFPARYSGRGFVTVEKKLTLSGLARDGEAATAVFCAGGDVSVTGRVEAAVLAPRGRAVTPAAGAVVGQAVVGQVTDADDFTVEAAPEMGAAGPEGLSVDVAPAPLAEALLRS